MYYSASVFFFSAKVTGYAGEKNESEQLFSNDLCALMTFQY